MSNSQIVKIQTIFGELKINISATFDPPNNESQVPKRGRGRPRKQIVNIPVVPVASTLAGLQPEPEVISEPDQIIPEPEVIPEPEPEPEPILEMMTIDDLQTDEEPLIISKRKRGRPIGSLSCKTRFNNLFVNLI